MYTAHKDPECARAHMSTGAWGESLVGVKLRTCPCRVATAHIHVDLDVSLFWVSDYTVCPYNPSSENMFG